MTLSVAHTDHRGHAVEIAQAAAEDGIDAVIVHGGDGTVNEVVNGVLGRPAAGPPRRDAPVVGVVPGGSANVFARSLGISPEPVEATNQLVDLLDAHRSGSAWRRIGLMDCSGKWGIFTAGMGVDAEVVEVVEAQRNKGRKVTAARYIRATVALGVRSARRAPTLTVHLPGQEPISGVHFAFVSNTSPWTYANARPVWTNPTTTYETGIGVFAATSTNILASLRLGRQMLAKRPRLELPHLIRDDDLPRVRLTSSTPIATQIDGDYLGLREEMEFTAVADVLDVAAPPPRRSDQA